MVKIQDASTASGLSMDAPDGASLEAAMQVPITVMLGPTGPLLRKLHSLMAPGQGLAPDALNADDIRLLGDALQELCISLKNMSEDDEASFTNRWWMKIARELCYDAEDHLDEVIGAGAHLEFSELLARVKDAKERRERFKWFPLKAIEPADCGEAGVSRLTSQMSPELPAPMCVDVDTGGARSTVGAVELPNKLLELLALDDDNKTGLKVIPINGCAGVGKTTAARGMYHRHGGKFQCRAFVTVSRNPDMRGFLTSMLSQLKAPWLHGFPDVPDLIDAINKHLQGKRYFIVIDDLWTASVWNIISRAFPRGDYCSRIITTSQIDDVALACCSYDSDHIYKMAPLNDHESRKLFFGRVFGSEDGCPTDIKEVSYEIARKCGGLPLAIVSIASLLASESNIREKWKHIQDSLSTTSDGMKDVVNLIYSSLPPRLRTCLLYLSMYAQGYVIKKDELVKQWVAEGFLSAVGGRDTEEIAEGYFDVLVSRGMVQAVDTSNNGEVLSCTVHHIVLDFIRHKSMEENFVITVDYFQSTVVLPDKVRRLSVQFGGVKSAYIPESIVTSQVRSLIFWGFLGCVPSITDYGLLRVLILHIWADEDNVSFDLTGIGELFLLKYLEIECNITVKLPDKDKIRWLQHLETLQVHARLCAVPSDIVNMKRLLHLRLPSEYILPSVVTHMASLRTLGYFDIGSHSEENVLHLGRLTNLQDLQLTCSRVRPAEKLEKNVQLLGSILEKLNFLHSLSLVPAASGSSCVNFPEDGFSMAAPPTPDLLLRRIKLSWRCCILCSLPKWFGELRKLCILKIAIRKLSWEDTDMLKGLPSLTALTLYIQTVSEERIVIDKGGFQALTNFKFMCATPCLSFVQGAMPKVQNLKLGFNSNEWRSHTFGTVGFCHLTGLTEVSVKLGARRAREFNIKAAEPALEAAVRYHPNSPTIRVQFVDVISYGEEKIQEIQDGRKKKRGRSEEKRHEIGEGKKKTGRSEEHLNKPLVDSRYARTGRVATPLKHHTQSVNVVTGALGSLLPKLLELLKAEYNLEAKVKDNVQSLHKELEGMQVALREVVTLEPTQLDDLTRIWAKEVRDLSYDVEDVIDSLPVRADVSKRNAPHEIADAITGIMKQAQDLATRRERYKVGIQIAADPNAAASFEHPRPSTLYKDPKELVGINVFMDEVIKKLTHGTGDVLKKLKIVSIVGMGGLGKTTLAKAVYDRIQVQYDYTAFVPVSRYPDMRRVYLDILFEIGKKEYMNPNFAKFDESQLIDEVRGLLANKRYLIVFDDIWDVNSCEVIKFALIDSGFGSRVVTTTRILEVALNAGDVYRLKALPHSHSKELFNTRLFGGKDNVPHVVPKVPERVLQKCGGVPLAIITMASLLVGKPMNDWSNVYNNIGFGSGGGGNTDVDNARNILLSSYYDLPYHLRECLLHLHIFPEGCLIKKETLIWKWAAEGLIVEKPGTRLFELGEGYFQELLNRNVVMPVEDDSHPGKAIGCRVHDVVLDMICSLSIEENFVTVLDGSQELPSAESKARRLAIQNWKAVDRNEQYKQCKQYFPFFFEKEEQPQASASIDAHNHLLWQSSGTLVQTRDVEQGDPLANIRPERLRSFNITGCHFSTELSLSRFKLLRVVAIEECTFKGYRSYHLKYVGELLLLRYLGLYNTHIEKLPEEICGLIYLQTLDLRGTRVCKLPGRVALLRQLKCLRTDKNTAVPDWIGNLTSLEELRLGYVRHSKNIGIELGKLTELRELEILIGGLDGNQNKALVQSMTKLKKIQVLRFGHWSTSGDTLNWEDFNPPGQLRELHLNITSRLPTWINVSRVPMLSYLSVDVKAVEDQDLNILGALPELISLDLRTPPDVFLSIKGGGAFPKLRFFRTYTPFRFLPEAMPRLESLCFKVDRRALNDANVNFDDDFVASTLGSLVSLEKVEVIIRSTGNVEAMHEALKLAVDKHPNCPSLHVRNQN